MYDDVHRLEFITHILYFTDNKLANYGPATNGCPATYAISLNRQNDDLQHPIVASGTTLVNMDADHIICFRRPTVG